jgi:hypothetical protein
MLLFDRLPPTLRPHLKIRGPALNFYYGEQGEMQTAILFVAQTNFLSRNLAAVQGKTKVSRRQ